MSKKKNESKKKKPNKPAWNKRLSFEQESHVKEIIMQVITPIEKRITSMYATMINIQSNLAVSMALLEKHGVLEREEFFREFEKYQSEEIGIIDEMGRMEGNSVFSLYNIQ